MIKVVSSPSFYDGPNILLLDDLLKSDLYKRIIGFDIKCYNRTFDDSHPNIMEKILPSSSERYLIVTINQSVVDHFFYKSPQHIMDSTYFARKGEIYSLTLDEADHIFRSYQVGIQHVSEIMLTNGYWIE